MVLFGNVHALSSRSETQSLFTMPPLRNPFLAIAVPFALLLHLGAMHVPGLRDVLDITPVDGPTLLTLAGIALVFLAFEEGHKATLRWRRRAPEPGAGSQAPA